MSETALATYEQAAKSGNGDEKVAFIKAHHGELDDAQLAALFKAATDNDGSVEEVVPLIADRIDPELLKEALGQIANGVEAPEIAKLLLDPEWERFQDLLLGELAAVCVDNDLVLEHIQVFENAGVPRELTIAFVQNLANDSRATREDLVLAYEMLASHVSRDGKVRIVQAMLRTIDLEPGADAKTIITSLRDVALGHDDTDSLINRLLTSRPTDPDADGVAEEAIGDESAPE